MFGNDTCIETDVLFNVVLQQTRLFVLLSVQWTTVPAHQALRAHVNLSLGRNPDPRWKRRPGRPRCRWIDQIRKDNNDTLSADLWRRKIGRGHGASLRPKLATRWTTTTNERIALDRSLECMSVCLSEISIFHDSDRSFCPIFLEFGMWEMTPHSDYSWVSCRSRLDVRLYILAIRNGANVLNFKKFLHFCNEFIYQLLIF